MIRGEAQVSPPNASRALWIAAAALVLVASALAAGYYYMSRSRSSPALPAPAAADVPAPVTPFSVECSAVIQKYRDGAALKEPMAIAIDKTLVVEQGDRIRMSLASPVAGWLYVLNETTGAASPSDLRVLYPVSWAGDSSGRMEAAQPVALPPDVSNWIEFDAERGTEAFWIVWSASELPEFAGIGALANPRDRGIVDSTRAASIRSVLAAARPAVVTADGAKTVIRGEASPIVYRLEIQHY